MKKGKSERLSTEKAIKLAEAGFEFTVAPNKKRPSRQNLYNPWPHLARRAAEAEDTENNNDDGSNESINDDENDEEDEEKQESTQEQQDTYIPSFLL